jgi:Na+/H+-dicarboxylate symporter
MLKNTALQTIVAICFVLIIGPHLPLYISRSFYTLSLLIRDLLMYVLPIAIFAYITSMLSGLKQRAFLLVGVLLCFEALSNTLSISYAYGIGFAIYSKINLLNNTFKEAENLSPFFSLGQYRPQFYTADKGTLLGVLTGFFFATGRGESVVQTFQRLKKYIDVIFSKILAKLIPVMVLGFLLNIQKSGLLDNVSQNYGFAFLIIILGIIFYLLLLFIIAGSFRIHEIGRQIQNIWPAGVIAFTSSSSAATMPFTIVAVEKNLQDPSFAGLIIPATTNIQQIGDCIANVFFGLLILKQFGFSFPEFNVWLSFMAVYVLARFTTAGMIGGAIFILIPIYEKYLGFTPEMSSVLLALNIVLDSFITSSNVLANGALCVIFEKIWLKVKDFQITLSNKNGK